VTEALAAERDADAAALALDRWRRRVEAELERWLPKATDAPERLHAAQRYSVLGAGKRIRPALVHAAAATLGVPPERVDGAACAVELVHCYSLVHDDLPAMDDDDLRRGRPTCHRAYDEATAILAGDSLQSLAFQVLATHPGTDGLPEARLGQVALLAEASGSVGMAGGQALDLAAAGRRITLAELERLHSLKTGALIRASVLMPTHCLTALPAARTQALSRFSLAIGLAFQIQDDILDVEGDVLVIGKPPGSDQARGMPTYTALAGLDGARQRVRALHDEARALLREQGWDDSPLGRLTDWLMLRNR
jgi:farnesyl diphosphate synthase